MKSIFVVIVFLFSVVSLSAQQEFHVFPTTHKTNPGKASGNGSITNPWDLQTALSQSTKKVNDNDVIYIHKGIYNGRFTSTITVINKNTFITVRPYKKDKVVLNGNVTSKLGAVLEVKGGNVIFQEGRWIKNFKSLVVLVMLMVKTVSLSTL